VATTSNIGDWFITFCFVWRKNKFLALLFGIYLLVIDLMIIMVKLPVSVVLGCYKEFKANLANAEEPGNYRKALTPWLMISAAGVILYAAAFAVRELFLISVPLCVVSIVHINNKRKADELAAEKAEALQRQQEAKLVELSKIKPTRKLCTYCDSEVDYEAFQCDCGAKEFKPLKLAV